MTEREKIVMGECQSPYTVDHCPYCIDSCDASFYKRKYNELLDDTINEVWVSAKIKCDTCLYESISVYHKDSKELECSNCANYSSFTVVEFLK